MFIGTDIQNAGWKSFERDFEMKSISDTLVEKIYDKNAGLTDDFEPLDSEPFLANKREYLEKESRFHESLRADPDLCQAYEDFKVAGKDVLNMMYFSLYEEGAKTGAKLMLDLIGR